MASTPVPHSDLGRGLDQFHPESKLPDGYWADLLNADPTADGSIKKRPGYQRYAGSIPIRVTTVTRAGDTNIDFSVDSSFDLDDLRSTPILVYGRTTSTQSGDFSTTPALVYYSGFTISSGKIRVVDAGAVSATYTDTTPQLTIWGVAWDAVAAATDAADRWGWVQHLSVYSNSTDRYPIAGLGGNLFAGRTRTDVGSTYGMPRVYPLIRGTKNAGTTVVGPAFALTGQTPSRTRSYVTGDGVAAGFAACTAGAYDASSGYVDFTVSLPNMVVAGTLATSITADLDYLTVDRLSSGFNGTWLIKTVTQGADLLTIRCAVDDVTDTRYDVSGAGGLAGIFTDKLTLTASGTFDADDVVASTTFPLASTEVVVVASSSGTTLMVGGLDAEYSVGAGEVFYGTRTSKVLVPRDVGGSSTTANLVRGDMLSITQAGTDLSRRVRVVSVNTSADRTVSIAGDGAAAVMTITAGDDSTGLSVGDIIRLRGAGVYNGDHVLTEITSASVVEFESTETASVSGATLVGACVGLDESIELADHASSTSYVEVHARWIPLEWPTPPSSTLSSTKVQHFDQSDYDDQQFISSAMSQDNMYFADGVHPIHKYDGTNLYRAGLPKWQSRLTTNWFSNWYRRAYIAASAASVAVSGVEGSTKYTCAIGDENKVSVGDRVVLVRNDVTPLIADVVATYDDSTDGFIELTRAAPATFAIGAGDIYQRQSFRYYHRLQLLDANNNIVATAQTSNQDINTVFGQPSHFQHVMLPYPRLDGFDLSRMDLQLYRTTDGSAPPFFRLASLPTSFAAGRGYQTYTDVTPSEILIDESGAAAGTLDEVASALVGGELGTAWDQPPICKYLASTSGRLLGANITDYEQLDLLLRTPRSSPGNTFNYKSLHGACVYLRREGDTGTATDMDDVLVYEVHEYETITSTARQAQAVVNIAADGQSMVLDWTAASINGAAGDWIYVFQPTALHGSSSQETYIQGLWQVASANTTGGRNYLTIKGNFRPPLSFTNADVSTGGDTITISAHGLVTGDIVTLGSTPAAPAGLTAGSQYYVIRSNDGLIQLASTLANALAGTEIDITTAGSGTYYLMHGGFATTYGAVASVQTRVPVVVFAESTSWREEGGYATRAEQEETSSAKELQFPRKLAAAINASMTNYDAVLYPNFRPWVSAFAGNDYGPGQLILRRLDVASTSMTFEHTLPATALSVYNSGSALAVSTRVSATRRVFPSRICRSYKNYPEIFDAPYAQLDTESDSAIDVNPADGEEITGMRPFFGDSAFGQASKEAVLLVTKERSVYLVDVETKQVQKLQTRGKGCVYPRTLEETEDGIMFGTEDGLYKINRQFQCVFLGKWVRRPWRERMNHNAEADVPCATHDQYASQYRVSIPVGSDESNSETLVYSYERESGDEPGAWTRYDNIPATCWTNLDSDNMFGTTTGGVMSMRRSNTRFDFRDDADGVSMLATYKAVNFGSAGIRNFVHAVTVGFRLTARMAGTVVRAATALLDSFSDLDIFTDLDSVDLTSRDAGSNLTDLERAPVRTPQFGLPEKRVEYLQMQFENSTIDEPVEITEIVFHVEPGNKAGTLAASEADD